MKRTGEPIDRVRQALGRPFPLAAAFFLLVTARHWVALPTLITWDGHEYLDLSDVLGSERFPRDWLWLRTPLFPLGLKLSFAVLGRNPFAATAVPLTMAVLGCFLVASCVRQVAGAWAASLSLVLLAVYPTLIVYEHAILTETGTFFFVALALRLALWNSETVRAGWVKAVSLGIVLGAGYYWRQMILGLVPWFVLLHLLPRQRSRSRRETRLAFLQALLLVLVPWLVKSSWSLFFDAGKGDVAVVQAFAIKQELIPPDDPRMAQVAAEYREAIEKTAQEGRWSGIPWQEVSHLLEKVGRPSSASVLAFLAPLVAHHPARYAAGVARTLLFFAGLDGAENPNKIYRTLVLSPALPDAKIEAGPAHISDRVRREFFHRTTPGLLQRVLWSLCVPFDGMLIVCNVAVLALLVLSVRRKDDALLAISGTPVYFALMHAVLLFSINRFMVPIYPLTLACGAVSAVGLARRLTRPFGKELDTMATPPPRRPLARVVTLVTGAVVLLGLLYAVARFYRSGDGSPGGAPEKGAVSKPAAAPRPAALDEANVLPGFYCGTLDGAKPTPDGGVFLWGWAYDPRVGAPASSVILLDNGQPVSPPIQVHLERPDVAAAKGKQLLLKSGWNLRLPASSRRGREHVFRAYAVFADGKLGRLGGQLTIAGTGD